nr:sigma-70 family RNA polymerase sigma factor [uncultured Flavobacterium sp.]
MQDPTNEKQFISQLLDAKTQNQAFRKLISENKNQLYYHIRNIVLNHDDTDDVLQNTFIKIFLNLNSFNHESRLSTWMYKIATNEALNFLNSKAKKYGLQTDELQESLIENLTMDDFFSGDEIELKLQKAIATLPEKQQLVFKMKYFQELKYEEIAEILDTSVGGLKASYHHAVKKIENFIQNN